MVVELLLELLPLGSVKLSQSLVPQNFKFRVGFFQLGVHVFLISLVALADSKLIVGLMPFGVSADSIELSGVALVVGSVILTGSSLHDSMLGVSDA